MAILQLRSKRQASGARYKRVGAKRLGRLGRLPVLTKIAANKTKTERTVGGNTKDKMLSANKVNLFDPATKKREVVAVKTVLENPANRHFVRRNIVTKGCIVDTDKGKAKITSRPGQNAFMDAVLLK